MKGIVSLLLLGLPVSAVGKALLEPLPFRDYGFFVGDLVERCWRLKLDGVATVSHHRLPRSLGRWLVIRRVVLEGGRLCVQYQVDYAPFTTETVEIPEWSLTLRLPQREYPVTLPSWRLTLAPLRPIQSLKGEAFMQAEALPPLSLAKVRRRFWLGLGLTMVGLTGLAWHLWGGRRRVRWPFCRAWVELARLENDEAGRLKAYLLLHRAFDTYWGGRWWGRLEAFLQRYPAYRPLAEELTGFVASSRGLFFAAAVPAEPWSMARLRALARRLAWEEIRHGGLAG